METTRCAGGVSGATRPAMSLIPTRFVSWMIRGGLRPMSAVQANRSPKGSGARLETDTLRILCSLLGAEQPEFHGYRDCSRRSGVERREPVGFIRHVGHIKTEDHGTVPVRLIAQAEVSHGD